MAIKKAIKKRLCFLSLLATIQVVRDGFDGKVEDFPSISITLPRFSVGEHTIFHDEAVIWRWGEYLGFKYPFRRFSTSHLLSIFFSQILFFSTGILLIGFSK